MNLSTGITMVNWMNAKYMPKTRRLILEPIENSVGKRAGMRLSVRYLMNGKPVTELVYTTYEPKASQQMANYLDEMVDFFSKLPKLGFVHETHYGDYVVYTQEPEPGDV